jgi:hypothetical protein
MGTPEQGNLTVKKFVQVNDDIHDKPRAHWMLQTVLTKEKDSELDEDETNGQHIILATDFTSELSWRKGFTSPRNVDGF